MSAVKFVVVVVVVVVAITRLCGQVAKYWSRNCQFVASNPCYERKQVKTVMMENYSSGTTDIRTLMIPLQRENAMNVTYELEWGGKRLESAVGFPGAGGGAGRGGSDPYFP